VKLTKLFIYKTILLEQVWRPQFCFRPLCPPWHKRPRYAIHAPLTVELWPPDLSQGYLSVLHVRRQLQTNLLIRFSCLPLRKEP